MYLQLFALFLIQLIVLFSISRKTIQSIFNLIYVVIPAKSVQYSIIALIFFPGTILHELSHFLMAILLLLKVKEINLFPEWSGGYLKLGKVIYVKKDVVRGILVGIAPIIVGLLFFWWMSVFSILNIEGIWTKALSVYLIFVISTTMFSSRQDLVDAIYVFPVIILLCVLFYFFQIDISFITRQEILVEAAQKFLYDINIYLGISIVIHVLLVISLYLLQRVIIHLSS